jgi:ethanolamine utilization protein EutQ (cupin superfamily)
MTAVSKIYAGDRTIDGVVVKVDGVRLAKYSDYDFEWGYEGASPLHLAEAILANHLGDAQRARVLAPGFMQAAVANFANEWEMTSEDIDRVLGPFGEHTP